MSRRCKVSSLSAALAAILLTACGDDGAGSTAGQAESTSGATGEVVTTGEVITTGEVVTTGDGSSGDVVTTGEPPDDGSTGDDTTGDPGSEACADSVLTWENFGEPFALSWCTGCHHSALPTADRAGAPCGINFDTHAGASLFAQNIHVRVLDWSTLENVTPMPPAAIVPDDELALLREWLDCGAPGPETGQAGLSCPDP